MADLNELNLNEMEDVTGGSGGSPKRLKEKKGCIVYQIQPGDRLGIIARNNNTTCEAIKKVNPTITNVNDITAGFWIYIPV